MSNKILIKRGSGAPTTSDLDNYEIAYDTGANKLYIRDGSDIIPFAAIVDEDNFASDDANRVPSQQSTKAYIASELAAAGAGDITAVVAGTGLSGGATSGSATLNVSGLTVSELAANSLTTSSESFADNDTTLMTSAAINDRIESFGYITSDTTLSTEQVQDIVGAMFSGNTETRISATYQDSDGTIDLVVDDLDTDTQLTTENVQDIVGAMFSSNTETRISATYQDGDGTIDLVVDDMTADNNTNQLTTFTLTADSGSNQTIAHGNTLDIAGGTNITTSVGSTDTVTINLDDLPASKITSGELATARVNWDSTDKTVRWDNGRGYHGNPRSVAMGYSGGNYGQLGYNIEFTTTSNEHTYSFNDIATRVDLYDGILVYTSDTGGTAGSTISWTELLDCRGDVFQYKNTNIALISNGSDNRIVTSSSATNLNGEANLTFDGTNLDIAADDSKLRLGAGNDGQIYVSSDNLIIRNVTADKDVILQCDDGSGGETAYITLDGSATLVNFDKASRHMDNTKLYLGGGLDLELYHTGSDSYIANTTGDLYIQNEVDDKDIIFRTDDGSGGVTPYITLDGSATQTLLHQDTSLTATKKLYFDSGGHTYIHEESADNLQFQVGGKNMFRLHEGNSEAVFNDGGFALDLRVEGDTDTDLFFVDGSADNVGISTNSPGEKLDLRDGNFRLGGFNTGSDYGAIFTPADSASYWHIYNDEGGHLAFGRSATIGSSEKMRIDSSGNVGIGETSLDANLHITGSPVVIKMERAGHRAMRMGTPDNSSKFIFADADDLKSNIAIEIDSSRDVKITESVGIGVAANGTAGRLDCSNDIVAFASSDKRLKENIKPLDNALNKLDKINGVEFDWKKLTEKEKETIHGNTGHDVGVIAQEIEEVLPEVVQTRDNGYKAVKYEKLVPLLIESIKELKEEVNGLKSKLGG